MPMRAGATIVKILVASLAVGWLLSFFDIHPRDLLSLLGATTEELMEVMASLAQWAFQYIVIGAVVVVPIWAVMSLFRIARKKTPSRE